MKLVAAMPLMLAAATATARADGNVPRELDGIGIDDKHGARLPTELAFRDQTGAEVKLGDYLDGKPLILVLAYYQCPMLCSFVLNGVVTAAQGSGFTLGEGFRILTVSFDPRDTVQLAAAKQENYLRSYGKPVTGKRPWDFLVSDPATVKKLADTVGFHFRWDEDGKQFAHAAGIFVFTPQGQLSRVLYGIDRSRDLRLALVEASQGKLGSAWDQLLLFCYHYDPTGRGYTVAVLRMMKLGGGLTVLILALWLIRLWRRDRHVEHATDAC
jgi:protein SCO1/2